MNSIAIFSFFTHLTFDLIMRLRHISSLGIHPYGCWHISMDATFYLILPSEEFFIEWTANYNAAYQAPRSFALWFWRRRFLRVVTIYGGGHLGHVTQTPPPTNKLSFPHPMEAPHDIWLWLAQRFRRRSCLKMVDDDGRTDERACLYYMLTHEPKGSGELINRFVSFIPENP